MVHCLWGGWRTKVLLTKQGVLVSDGYPITTHAQFGRSWSRATSCNITASLRSRCSSTDHRIEGASLDRIAPSMTPFLTQSHADFQTSKAIAREIVCVLASTTGSRARSENFHKLFLATQSSHPPLSLSNYSRRSYMSSPDIFTRIQTPFCPLNNLDRSPSIRFLHFSFLRTQTLLFSALPRCQWGRKLLPFCLKHRQQKHPPCQLSLSSEEHLRPLLKIAIPSGPSPCR